MKLPIITYPNKVLETKASPIEDFDEDLEILALDMLETMRSSKGIGLAANQVNILKRILVISIPHTYGKREPWHNQDYILINPKITYKSDEMINFEEGCLSFPGLVEEVDRHRYVEVEAQDTKGKLLQIKADGLFSVCLQHEIDHLNGIVFTERSKGKEPIFSRLWTKPNS